MSLLFGSRELEPNTDSTLNIGIDETDAGALERLLDSMLRGNISSHLTGLTLNPPYGCDPNFGVSRKIVLSPAQERPGCPDLIGRKH